MTDDPHWGSLPFLRVLRPEPGESVEGAIVATYSADLVVVAAALLALAELDDDRGSGSKVDFANAFDRLHGRFSVLCQRGRTTSPVRNVLVLKLMDQFLKEVESDERQSAWHPKIALVWLRDQPGALRWRLWLGSRNLTKSTAWELGLTLTSVEKGGQAIPGIARLGEVIGERAGLAEWDGARLRRELERVRWAVPRGIGVKDIHLFDVGEARTLPAEPAGLKKLVVDLGRARGPRLPLLVQVPDSLGSGDRPSCSRAASGENPALRRIVHPNRAGKGTRPGCSGCAHGLP